MMFNYLSFGYIPVGKPKKDLIGRFTGVRNIFKRLQARAIMRHLDPKPGEKILDFGCGGGFFTYECARRGALCTGVDIVPVTCGQLFINDGIADFVLIGRHELLPFPDGYFDKVFMSEVIPDLDQPGVVLNEVRRVLKDGGIFLVVNTLGRPCIKEAYEKGKHIILFLSRLTDKCPSGYEDFCRIFMKLDNRARSIWYSQEEILGFLSDAGFGNISTVYPFKRTAFTILAWMQFISYCTRGTIVVKFGIVRYALLEILNGFSSRKDVSNILIRGVK